LLLLQLGAPGKAILEVLVTGGAAWCRAGSLIRTPKPNVARLRSVATHTVFGLGLYASAWALARLVPLLGAIAKRIAP
jgi:hypothetical protein